MGTRCVAVKKASLAGGDDATGTGVRYSNDFVSRGVRTVEEDKQIDSTRIATTGLLGRQAALATGQPHREGESTVTTLFPHTTGCTRHTVTQDHSFQAVAAHATTVDSGKGQALGVTSKAVVLPSITPSQTAFTTDKANASQHATERPTRARYMSTRLRDRLATTLGDHGRAVGAGLAGALTPSVLTRDVRAFGRTSVPAFARLLAERRPGVSRRPTVPCVANLAGSCQVAPDDTAALGYLTVRRVRVTLTQRTL